MDEGTAYLITVSLRFAVTGGTINVGKANGAEVAAKTGTSTVDGATIKALGLKKLNSSVELPDSESLRGQIHKVEHLLHGGIREVTDAVIQKHKKNWTVI